MVRAVERAAADVLGEAPPLAAFPGRPTPGRSRVRAASQPWPHWPRVPAAAHGPNEWVSILALQQAPRIFVDAESGMGLARFRLRAEPAKTTVLTS